MTFDTKAWYFLLAALFAVFAMAAVLSDSFREYESDMTVLVLPKSPETAASIGSVLGNIIALSQTDAFLSSVAEEKTIGYGLGIEGIPGTFSVERGGSGSLLHVHVATDDPDISRDFARAVSSSLFRMAGRYYNVKEEVDFRIIEGPSVVSAISNPVFFAALSIALGIAVTGLFFSSLSFLPKILTLLGGFRETNRPVLDAKVFEPERPDSPFFVSEESKDREEAVSDISGAVSEGMPIVTLEKKGAAPKNLPALSAAEAEFLQEFSFDEPPVGIDNNHEKKPESVVLETAQPTQETRNEEPTEDEYKRRLNELLKG